MVQSLLYRLWLNDSCVVKAKATIVIHKVKLEKKPKIAFSEMWDSNYMTFEIESIVRKKRGIQIWWLSNTTHAFNTLKVDSVSYWISRLFSNGNGSGSDANFIFDKPCLLPNRMHTESVLQTYFEPTLFTFPDWIIHPDFLIVCFEFNILFEIQIAHTPKTNKNI